MRKRPITPRLFFVTGFFVLLGVFCGTYSSGATSANPLGIKLSNYALNAPGLLEALAEIGSEFHLRMGIQLIANPDSLRAIRVRRKGGQLQGLLASLALTPPGYRIDLQGPVLRFSPRQFPGPGRDFLGLVVPSFNVDGAPVELASRMLFESANAAMRVGIIPRQRSGGTGGSVFFNPDEPRVAVHLTDRTIGEVLDSLIVVSNRKIWFVVFPPFNAVTGTGFRKTCSWDGKHIPPDDQQPTWDMITWGEDPISWRPRPDWKLPTETRK